MNATINVTELACELAHNELKKLYTKDGFFQLDKVYVKDSEGGTTYTEEAQDVFNQLNDEMEELIMNCQDKTASCNIAWYKADIESLGFECSDEEAEEVFELAENNHDANVGVNWEVLESWCEYVGLKRKDS